MYASQAEEPSMFYGIGVKVLSSGFAEQFSKTGNVRQKTRVAMRKP